MWQRIKNVYHFFVALAANIYYGFPSKNLTVVGVTGTDGKTTTASLIYHILSEAGLSASLISTVGAKIQNKDYDLPFHVTTPSPFALQKLIRKAAQKRGYLVLEVTSHAIDQFRVWGIDFKISVLTNITHEHLDYHKTYENYVKTKVKLLKSSQLTVINCEDESFPIVKKELNGKDFLTYGLKSGDLNLDNFEFKSSILGDFNKLNILAATLVCKNLGVNEEKIKRAISTFIAPEGRMEVVYNKEFKIIIDFAHTPNALDKILHEVRKNTKNKLIHVFGSAGNRDKTKRPLMGKVSSKYSDAIILTSEDPRNESAETIMEEIKAGIKATKKVIKIKNRKKAIEEAVFMARKGDTVIITGKAHERSMNIGGRELPWNELSAVNYAIKEIN